VRIEARILVLESDVERATVLGPCFFCRFFFGYLFFLRWFFFNSFLFLGRGWRFLGTSASCDQPCQ